ncbi:MAG: TonB-dependent receptor [Ignavibacteriaceae bacterium]
MYYAVILIFLFRLVVFAQQDVLVSGSVTDSETGKPLINANILINPLKEGTVTDQNGEFSVSLPQGNYEFIFSYVGYESQQVQVDLNSDTKLYELNITLIPVAIKQQEVNIIGERYPVSTVVREVEGENIRKMPTVFTDVLRSVKILPGVVSNDELSTGYNVRGGNYDQNLVYLNGFEIHRPFLIKEGLEESQSLINPDMVKDIKFFAGAFPSTLGDKLSSALEVTYLLPDYDRSKININADLLKAGVVYSKKFENIRLIGGARYSYPSLFGNRLQRKGDYNPSFLDFQIFGKYNLSLNSSLEFLALKAINTYDLKPDNWKGHFQTGRFDVKEVSIDFTGSRNSEFNTGLYALKYLNRISDNTFFSLSTALITNKENEFTDLKQDIYFSIDAYNPEDDKELLKNRFENSDNKVELLTVQLKPQMTLIEQNHTIEAGFDFNFTGFSNKVYQNIFEQGPDSTLELPIFTNLSESYSLNSSAFYLQDMIKFGEMFLVNAGMRLLNYSYNKEINLSPRISFFFTPDKRHTISLSGGYYFQQPFVYELRENTAARQQKLQSQKSLHLILGWDYRSNEFNRFQIEIFYKRNSDLIPFNIESMQIKYEGTNSLTGYSYGLDFQYEGEIVEGMKSWIGYSYLNSVEKPEDNSSGYRRSILDQTHTIKIFLQDRMRKLPNFQSHARFLFGTGMLYHPKISVIDDQTGLTYLKTDFNSVQEFPFYFRLDMGLSFRFVFDENTTLTLIAEVLNVFDKNNIAGYTYYTIFPLAGYPIGVPQIFSKRFFNLGINLNI